MHEAYATTAGSPKMAGDKTCTVFPETYTVSPLQAAITNLIKMQNPHKAWVFVSDLFGLKERSAKHRLANERSYTIEELQRLAYTDLLSDLPLWAIQRGFRKIKLGQAEDVSLDFPPSAPRLRKVVADEMIPLLAAERR